MSNSINYTNVYGRLYLSIFIVLLYATIIHNYYKIINNKTKSRVLKLITYLNIICLIKINIQLQFLNIIT